MEIAQRVVQIGGAHVRYAVTGRGSPVVLIHGLAGSWRWWARNIPVLREHHTLYLIDLPGFGGMRAYGREFSLATAPEWVRTLMVALELQRPSVIGHSMGGAIAMALAARWPAEVSRVVLAAPAVNLPHKSILSNAVPLLAATGHMRPRFYPTLLWDTMRVGPRTLLRTARDLFAMDSASDTRELQSPSLLIWGERDTLVPPKIGEMLQSAITSSRLHVIPGAGHVMMFDRPAEFNEMVLQFLATDGLSE